MKKKFKSPDIEFVGECYDYSHDGKGVTKYNGMLIFVDSFFLGEKATVKITYLKKDYGFGKILKLHEISKDRISPLCKVCTSCGGCCFQQLAYPAQLAYKKKKVVETLKRIGNITHHVEDVVGMENPYFYRNKIQMPVGLTQTGRIITGFYKAKSHDIVPIEKCYIENEKSGVIISKIKELMKKFRMAPYDEDLRNGLVRHILVKTSHMTNQVMVVLVTTEDSFPGRGDFTKTLHRECPEITTIVQNINRRDSNVILGDKDNILMGKGFIEDILCGIKFQISAKSFYQINPVQTEKLYNLAIETAQLTGKERILDAYCGIGTIGLIASSKVKEVVGVEIIKEAIVDAKRNAMNNKITNATFLVGDAADFMDDCVKHNECFDVVFLDPPRKGADEKLLNALLKLKPQRIIYISCDIATQARDLKYFDKMYEIQSISPVDMFPMTYHVETLVVLSRISGK